MFPEGVENGKAHVSDVVHSLLEPQAFYLHENNDHVIRVAARLLLVEREEILNDKAVSPPGITVPL